MYGGSFDPSTKGHLYIIRKAIKMFSNVHVVIADNHKKTSMFSREDRLSMMKEMIKQEFPNNNDIVVSELPHNTYLVNWAKENDCDALIRGIRDSLDFNYEHNICRTNKLICNDIETIYLMPDENLSVVSSSWVKGLSGMRGWQKIVRDAVHPCVFKMLQEKELGWKIDEIMNGLFELFLEYRLPPYKDEAIANIKMTMKRYRNRPYHNYEHILDGLEVFSIFREHWENPDYVMLYAWLMHDVDSNEDKSIEIALRESHLPLYATKNNFDAYSETWTKIKKQVTSFIEATKHKTWEYETEEERLFASVDLMNLGGNKSEYSRYNNLVCDEYRMMEKLDKMDKFNEDEYFNKWVKGRLDFIKKFLSRKLIYPSDKTTFASREHNARQNLVEEMTGLQEYIDRMVENGHDIGE